MTNTNIGGKLFTIVLLFFFIDSNTLTAALDDVPQFAFKCNTITATNFIFWLMHIPVLFKCLFISVVNGLAA